MLKFLFNLLCSKETRTVSTWESISGDDMLVDRITIVRRNMSGIIIDTEHKTIYHLPC